MKFSSAVAKIDKNCAVWRLHTSFCMKISLARFHLEELKIVEDSLHKFRPGNINFDETTIIHNAFDRNLIPCVINLKSSIESLKLSMAIKYSDEIYFKWEETLNKINIDLGIPITSLKPIETEVRDLRNFLVHAGHPTFTFNNKEMKLVVPKYKRLHPLLTVPNGNKGKIKLIGYLEENLKHIEDYKNKINNHLSYFQTPGAILSDDWIITP